MKEVVINNDLFLSSQELENKEQEDCCSLEDRVKGIKEITGYEFHDPILLQQAFTHHSYEEKNCSSYERLEYVGDSVLNFLISQEHFSLYPDLDPGKLTRLRAANVDTEKLARVALRHQLHKFLRHKKPLLAGKIKEFESAIKEYPLHSSGLVDAPKVLADIVESLIGAIFIDTNSSMDTTWKILKNLLQPMITPENIQLHPVTMFYETCQKHGLKIKTRDLWKETGEILFLVDDVIMGRAKFSGKRLIAYNRAAHNAYKEVIGKLTSAGK